MSTTAAAIPVDDHTTPSEAIVVTIAEREGVSSLEMPPLFEAIDPEALDNLFRDRPAGRVSFEYAGYEVVACGRERLSIHQKESHSSSPDYGEESNETTDPRFQCEAAPIEQKETTE